MSVNRKRFEPAERYVKLNYWMLKSLAWKSLSANARALYIEIAQRYNGRNNGMISYSVREGSRALAVSKDTANNALALLRERGFIVCTKRGAFSLKTTRQATTWRLTEHDADDMPGTMARHATKEFMRWTPPEPDCNVAPKSRTRSDRRDRTERPQGPYGTTTGTMVPKNGSYGTTTGTVNGQNHPRTVRLQGHIQLPGAVGEAEGGALPHDDHDHEALPRREEVLTELERRAQERARQPRRPAARDKARSDR